MDYDLSSAASCHATSSFSFSFSFSSSSSKSSLPDSRRRLLFGQLRKNLNLFGNRHNLYAISERLSELATPPPHLTSVASK